MKKITLLTHFFVYWVLLHASCSMAADKRLEISEMSQMPINLSQYFSILEDPSQQLSFADVQTEATARRFKTNLPDSGDVNYGHTDSAYWFRLHLVNTSDTKVLRLVEIGSPWLNNLDFYQPGTSNPPIATGSSKPFSSRPYKNRNFVFPVTLAAHSDQVVFLRIQSSNVRLPAKLWTSESFRVYERDNYLTQGGYFGIVLAMVLFNLFLCVTLRDNVYLLYIGGAICIALLAAEQHGLAEEFLWPDATLWPTVALPTLGFFTAAFYTQFMRRMLNTAQVLPKVDILIKWYFVIALFFPVMFIISAPIFFKIGIPVTLMGVALMSAVSIYCAIKRQRSAYYFVLAFVILGLSSVATLVQFSGRMENSFFTEYAVQIGSAVEMLLLAFALADRFNCIRRKAIDDVREVNASLEHRLLAREAELSATHLRLREVEQRTLLSKERQRMTQDMHDGLGSSLVTALRAVEGGQLDENAVTNILRDCIDDLKLAIDSMEVVDADLLLLLATLRFRLAPRLESAGIKLHWEIGYVPEVNWLTPGNSLHILRILQEAFTNAVKHASATEIHVSTAVESDNVLVTISNNGKGFDLEKALASGGKGLRNQLRRAEAIGGTVHWQSSLSGTYFNLLLPVVQKV